MHLVSKHSSWIAREREGDMLTSSGVFVMNLLFLFLCLPLVSANNGVPLRKNSSDSKRLIDSLANFATKFYQEIVERDDRRHNIVVSPLSVYMVLAVLRVGLAERSRSQIDRVMSLPRGDGVGIMLKDFAHSLLRENRTMNIASKIWQQKYFCFTQCRRFTKEVQQDYHADLGEVHFVRKPQEAAGLINRWVYVRSRGRIEKLLDENEVTRNTRFVLANMIYFKANWKEMFKVKITTRQLFTVFNDGKRVEKYVDTMFTSADFRHTFGFGTDYSLLELPYENENFAMIIILPLSIKDMDKVETSLNLTVLNDKINHLQSRPKTSVDVHLPKFCVSNGIALNDVLKAMGLTDIFDPSLADLSNLSGFKGMFVSNVQHEAFIKVSEQGTEAAGGSSVTSGYLSIPDVFRINRPFMFLIRHAPTQSIVFLGKINDPSIQNCDA